MEIIETLLNELCQHVLNCLDLFHLFGSFYLLNDLNALLLSAHLHHGECPKLLRVHLHCWQKLLPQAPHAFRCFSAKMIGIGFRVS